MLVLGYAGLCFGVHTAARVLEKKYGYLFKVEEHGVANRIVSSLHAALLGTIALRQFVSDLDPSQGVLLIPIHGAPFRLVESISAKIMLGYLLYDTVIIGAVMKQPSLPFAMLGHHILGAISWSLLLNSGEGGNYVLWVHLAELSTPFLNAGWAMHMLGIKGIWAKLAALATVSAFALFRVISVLLCINSLWQNRHLFVKSMFPLQFGICVGFWFLNCMWFRQLIAVALKASRSKDANKPAQN